MRASGMVSEQTPRDMTNSIVREFSPERIVLFGSYAYGTPTDDSDVELLIVMPLTEEWTR
jgi:predicted nucleotidyltransferase